MSVYFSNEQENETDKIIVLADVWGNKSRTNPYGRADYSRLFSTIDFLQRVVQIALYS